MRLFFIELFNKNKTPKNFFLENDLENKQNFKHWEILSKHSRIEIFLIS